MRLPALGFSAVDWAGIPRTEHAGETGIAYWQTCQFGDVRVRLVEYSAGYRADHWCAKGHVIFVLEGELHTELQDGRVSVLGAGMGYHVGDDQAPHRSFTAAGAKLFIVD